MDMLLGGLGAVFGIANTINNFGLERDKYNSSVSQYNTQLSEAATARMREDNAVQRRVADLRMAGLSPVLAAGSAASAAPIQTSSTIQGQGSGSNDIMQIANGLSTLMKNQKDMAFIDQQTRTSSAGEKLAEAQKSKVKKETEIDTHDLEIFKKSGTSSRDNSSIAQALKLVFGNKHTESLIDQLPGIEDKKGEKLKKDASSINERLKIKKLPRKTDGSIDFDELKRIRGW